MDPKYSKEYLKKLSKDELINLLLPIQSQIDQPKSLQMESDMEEPPSKRTKTEAHYE
jgi:hypothetical protein